MLDLRPVGYVIGRLLVVLGLLMLLPAFIDLMMQAPDAGSFVEASLMTTGIGGMLVLAMRNSIGQGLSTRLAFLLTVGIWALLPMFGALPFMMGVPGSELYRCLFRGGVGHHHHRIDGDRWAGSIARRDQPVARYAELAGWSWGSPLLR